MTLRITIEFVSLGREDRRLKLEVIEVINCGPVSPEEKSSIRVYRIKSKNFNLTNKTIMHDRNAGMYSLVRDVMNLILEGSP